MFSSWFSNSLRKFNKLGGILGCIPKNVVNKFKERFNKDNVIRNINILVKIIVKRAFEI